MKTDDMEETAIVQAVIENLSTVESSLRNCINFHSNGQYGYITKEWGFACPGGLGPRLGGKFKPWEEKLDAVPSFFWPIEAYQHLEEEFRNETSNRNLCPHHHRHHSNNLPPEAEKLYKNVPLHDFLMKPPPLSVEVTDEDLKDYRTASRIFLLLGTLSHLCGNSAPEPSPLPAWIEDPLVQAASRLDVEPSLTGHFVTIENWMWLKPISNKDNEGFLRDKELSHTSIIKTMLQKVETKDRRYRLVLYKNCFIASQAVDVLVDEGLADSREEAVRLGRLLNSKYNLFEHVTRDHSFMDDYLFFRFSKHFNKEEFLTELEDEEEIGVQEKGEETTEEFGREQEEEGIFLIYSVEVKTRRYRLKRYKNCFVASELVDLLVNSRCASSRQGAVRLARKINQKYNIFEHVCREHILEDDYLFFRFTDEDWESYSARSVVFKNNGASLNSNSFGTENSRVSDTIMRVQEGIPNRQYTGDSFTDKNNMVDSIVQEEFRIDHIKMLYPAFGNSHEKVNQLIPACMGYSFRTLPHAILEVLNSMKSLLEAKNKYGSDDDAQDEINCLCGHLYQITFQLSRCKEQFQLMSTDPKKRTFNSKHISIRQTQPFSNGVLVRGKRRKGVTGVQFPYFHILDWLLGRHQFGEREFDSKMGELGNYYPRPQREYVQLLSRLRKPSTLRGFLDVVGRPPQLLAAYNHLIECYAGEGGVLTAHHRKLFSYMHNDQQFSTSGTTATEAEATSARKSSAQAAIEAGRKNNHEFAMKIYNFMRKATEERWNLRIIPLMTEVKKSVYSTSESGGFTTVALDLKNTGLRYEYGDVVRVLLPNTNRRTTRWVSSLSSSCEKNESFLKLEDMPDSGGEGWTWADLWEALGWSRDEPGVPLEAVARYIERAQVRDEDGRMQWINSPLDLCTGKNDTLLAANVAISRDQLVSIVPVSPRVYSVSGVETDRAFLLVSKPHDGGNHHGYERMADSSVERVHCSFSPATFFLVPPCGVNLVCVASGTGISPFAGLADAIGSRRGTYTIVHQCKSSDMFLANCQQWLDFTSCNPGAIVMGYISGDRSRRNCPMRYIIRNGKFDETKILSRNSSSCYYFECPRLVERMEEVHRSETLNLAYCCGGVQSAIAPLQKIINDHGWTYELTVESYAVTTGLTSTKRNFTCQIGGAIVDLGTVAPVHEGGDQILHHVQCLALDDEGKDGAGVPDHSKIFWQLHPNAYNLHRCLRAPFDADFEAFRAFLARQAMNKNAVASIAEKYAKVALASPNSKVVRVASELQSSALTHLVLSGDRDGALKSAQYLETLLDHIPSQDDQAERWNKVLANFRLSLSD